MAKLNEIAPNKSEVKRIRKFMCFNVWIAVLLACAVWLVANYCSSLIYAHWNFDSKSQGGLSSHTINLLETSTGSVEIIAVFDKKHPFRKKVEQLINEYQEATQHTPALEIRAKLADINHDVIAANQIMREYQVDVNSIIIRLGTRYKVIHEADLILQTQNESWTNETQNDQILQFRGESACTAAMFELIHPKRPIVYFTQGHGEYDPSNHHQMTGASVVHHYLSTNQITVKNIHFNKTDTIPSDCDVLIIAGPRTTFSTPEIQVISSYLNRGGKAMMLLDDSHASGLTPLLKRWGVELHSSRQLANQQKITSSIRYGNHLIAKKMNNLTTFFLTPATIKTTLPSSFSPERADKIQITPLILLPQDSELGSAEDSQFYSPIAVAIESGNATLTGRQHNMRIVVCGDSDFISNAMTQQGYDGNQTFLLSALNWLVDNSEAPVMIDHAEPVFHSGILPDKGWLNFGIQVGVFIPLGILLFGLFFYIPISRKL